MRSLRLATLLCCAAFLFASCGGNDTKEETTTTNDSTAKGSDSSSKMTTPATNSNIITTPQDMVVVTHKVSNFAKWMAAYEGHDSARVAAGLHNYVIGRGLKDSNMVMVALKADDLTKAKAFGKDPSLKAVMQKGGVVGAPTIQFLTETWQDISTLGPDVIRSRTTFMVKDWDTWLKAFQDGKQERMDNGIADRVIGHDADNPKKVSLVTAVMDSTKAFAFYKSDELKKRRTASGVIGEPERFLFKVVKRY